MLRHDGRVYVMGSNDKWQCTEIEEMKDDENECVQKEHLEINAEDKKWLDEALASGSLLKKEGGPNKPPGSEDPLNIPVIPIQCRDLISKIQRQRPVKKPSIIDIIDIKQISNIEIKHISAGPNHAIACSTGN